MLLFWFGCITSTTPPIPPSTLERNNRSPLDCSHPYIPKKEQSEAYCWDEENERRHGQSTHTLPNGTLIFQYEEGHITQYRVKNTEKKDEEKFLLEYLKNDSPAILVKDFLHYIPGHSEAQNLRIRLYKDSQIPYSDLLAVLLPSETCTSTEQLCIKGRSFSEEIIDRGHSRTIITQIPTTYFDRQTIRALDVQDCIDGCLCTQVTSPAAKMTWDEANHYCTVNQKRLPTEAELILFSSQNEMLHSSEEWTSDWFKSWPDTLNVSPEPPCTNESTCFISEQKTIINPTIERKGGNKDEQHRFRCVTSTQESHTEKPTLLTAPPFLTPFSHVPTTKSWHKKDPLYQKMLDDSTLDQPFAYRDIFLLTKKLWKFHEQFPNKTAIYQIGTTHLGYPILAFRISNTPTSDTHKSALLFFAGVHGNELMGSVQILDQIDILLNTSDSKLQSISHIFDLWFVPLLNPDGNLQMMRINASSKMGRKNGRSTAGSCESSPSEGVDIQRNFPLHWEKSNTTSTHYSGSSPLSEPESKAIKNLAQRYHFLSSLSWHSPGNFARSAYANKKLKKPSPDIMGSLAKQMLETENKWPPKLRTPTKDIDFGNPEDWMFYNFGTYAYQVRIAKHNLVLNKYKQSYIEKYRYIWTQFLDAIHDQPSFNGIVMNGEKEPIVAQVRILGRVDKKNKFHYYENEEWTSRTHDGYYQQLVPELGVYEIEINALGYRKTRKRIQVEGPRTQSNIILRKAK